MISTSLPESDEYRRFRQNKDAVGRLAALLSDPVMSAALKIVDDMSRPQRLPDTTVGLNPDTCVAHHFHLLLGVSDAMKKLRKLAIAPIAGELDVVDPDRPEYQDHADKIQPMVLPKK